MVQKQGGVFGAVADSYALVKAIAKFSSSSITNGIVAAPNGCLASASATAAAADVPASVSDVTTVVVPAQPCDYKLPVSKAALVMIDFQKDFLCEGGFGAALGNDLSQLQVRACDAACCFLWCSTQAAAWAVVAYGHHLLPIGLLV
jgi:hypothetical protein